MWTETSTVQVRRPTVKMILDAPEIYHDFYSQLLSGGRDGKFAVALGAAVHLYHTATRTVEMTAEPFPGQWMSAVHRIGRTHILCGTSQGRIALVRPGDEDGFISIEMPAEQTAGWDQITAFTRVSKTDFIVGAKSGTLALCRMNPNGLTVVDDWDSHRGAERLGVVNGISRNPRNRDQIAIGDSSSKIMRIVKIGADGFQEVARFMTGLGGGKKAMAWDPSHPSRLAIGGGTEDKAIEIWERIGRSGVWGLSRRIEVGAQITGLDYSDDGKELVAACGFHGSGETRAYRLRDTGQELSATMSGHTGRVLGSVRVGKKDLVTVGEDECLRIWSPFRPAQQILKQIGLQGSRRIEEISIR